MKNKALAVESVWELPESRARGRRLSGHSHRPQARSWSEDRKLREGRLISAPPIMIFVCLLGIPGALAAQTAKSSWSHLNGLKAGQGIEVIESSMKRHAGEFVNVSDEVLTLQEKGS